jgi:protein phosphatase
MKYFGGTHIGNVREENQDAFEIIQLEGAFCATVCDGMGGANGGSIASTTALAEYHEYIKTNLTEEVILSDDVSQLSEILINGVKFAHEQVKKKARENEELEGMGTTLVSAFVKDGYAFVLNVGDSRCYCLNGEKLSRVTKDHSLVQELVDSGLLTEEEAENHPQKNCITKAIGVDYDIDPDVFYVPTFEKLLLCSDGLTNMVSEKEIKSTILDKISLDTAVNKLIIRAIENGGLDNITVALIKEEI